MNTRLKVIGYVGVLAFLSLAIPAGGFAQSAPVITALSFTPNTINTSAAPAAVTVNFTITDSSAGISYFETAFVDPSGVFYQRTSKSLNPPSSPATDSVTIPFPQFSPAGTWQLAYVFVADTSGNTLFLDSNGIAAAGFGTALQVSSAADSMPPSITAFSFGPVSIDTTAGPASVTANFSLSDDLSGASFFQLTFTSPSGGQFQSASANFTPATTATNSVTLVFPRFSEAGAWTLTSAILADAAGNTAILGASDMAAKGFPTTLTVTSTNDSTPPMLTSFNFAPNAINVTAAAATVMANFQATDDLAGVANIQVNFVSPSGVATQSGTTTFTPSLSVTGSSMITFPRGSENGVWTVGSVIVLDGAGNTQTLATADLAAAGYPTQLTVTNATGDTTPPVITPTISPAPNGLGWNTTAPVTVSFAVSDPESGISGSTGCSQNTLSAETPGTTFNCSATNGASLTNSVSVTVRIDLTPPVVTANESPSPNGAGWNNTNVNLTWNVSDSISGINNEATAGCDPVSIMSETSGTAFTCNAVNGAGLSRTVPVTVKVDKTPPTAAAVVSPSPNGAGWFNTNVTVSFAGTDSLSGIAGCSTPVVLGSDGAAQSASGICTDVAGNTSAVATASGINIDKTAPVASNVTVTPTQVYLNSGTTISATITDALSGVASAVYNVDGGAFVPFTATFGGSSVNVSANTAVFTTTGVHNICVVGTDVAGNSNSRSCTTVAVFTAAAPASGTTCNGAYNGTFNGTIVVSNGQTCDYEGTVTGSIQQSGGTLILLNASIGGSVQIVSGGAFSINSSTINGSLQVTSLPTGTAVNQVCNSTLKSSVQVTSSGSPVNIGAASGCAGDTITGTVQITSNHAQTQVVGNTIGGSLQDNSNVTTASPASQVTNNKITGALQCSGNSSIAGSGNTASVKQGQCSAF